MYSNKRIEMKTYSMKLSDLEHGRLLEEKKATGKSINYLIRSGFLMYDIKEDKNVLDVAPEKISDAVPEEKAEEIFNPPTPTKTFSNRQSNF